MATVTDRNDGLEVDVGITLGKLQRQLAAAEARMVRTAKRSETQFQRSNRRSAQSFERVTTATQGLTGSNGLRMVALQLSQVGQQGAMTGQYLRALSVQMPDLLLAFGTAGALIGTAAAALIPLAANLGSAEDEAQKLIDSLIGGQVSLDSVRGSISQLTDLQEKYTDAIRASGGASSATASAVSVNSKREFEARRQVLEVETELLRIRSQEQKANLRNLQDQARIAAENADRDINLGGDILQREGPGPGGRIDPELYEIGAIGRRTSPGAKQALDQFQEDNRDRRLAIERLQAEIELTDLAAEEAAAALNGVFRDVGGTPGGGAGGADGASGGGGGGASSPAAVKVREVNEELKKSALSADEMRASFGSAFASIISDFDNAGQAASRFFDAIANRLLQSAGNSLFDMVLGSVFGAATGGGKVAGPQPRPRARGGPVQAGRPYLVNEDTPRSEVYVPSRSGGILNVQQAQEALRGSSGGGAVLSFAPVINAPGADGAAIARLERRMDEMSGTFTARVDQHLRTRRNRQGSRG